MADSDQIASETQTQPAPDSAPEAPKTSAPASPEPAPAPAPVPAPSPAPAEPPKAEVPPAPVPPPIPDAYTLKAPEGLNLDATLVQAMTPTFKNLKLTNDQAQGLADTFMQFQKNLPAAMLAADLDRTMKDPEIGGMNYGRTQGLVNLALTAFTTPEDRAWMEKAGIGNRLEFVRTFARIGRAMSQDTPARGSPTSANKPTTADRLYGGGDLISNSKE